MNATETPQALLANDMHALAEHRWESVEAMFSEEAVCIFSEA